MTTDESAELRRLAPPWYRGCIDGQWYVLCDDGQPQPIAICPRGEETASEIVSLRSTVEALDAEALRLKERLALAEAAAQVVDAQASALLDALRAVEVHHIGINDAVGRPRTNSTTLRIVRAALAGCDHIPGDVCRRCHPSVPMCARHPEAPVRRCGPFWRCGVCGEDGTLLADASPSTPEPTND